MDGPEQRFLDLARELGLRERIEALAQQHPDASDEELGALVVPEVLAAIERRQDEEEN
jgi:hypothetical protein